MTSPASHMLSDSDEFSAPGSPLDGFPVPPSWRLLNTQFVSFDEEKRKLRLAFTAKEEFLNPAGIVQGGILTAMLDGTMGPLALALVDGEKFPSSTDIHTQFFKAAHLGRINAEARVTHMGRSTVFTRGELYDDAGDLLASAIQTARLISFKGGK